MRIRPLLPLTLLALAAAAPAAAQSGAYVVRLGNDTLAVQKFTISVAPNGQGGTLNLEWDTTRASIPFTVR